MVLKLSRNRSQSSQRSARPSRARHEQEHLTSAVARALELAKQQGWSTHALFVIDLDGFTRVQASFGAAAAERLLLAVGHRLGECLGPDDQAARVGADEFHVLVTCDGDAAGAWRVAELMLHVLTSPYEMEGNQVAITACVGIALARPHHASPTDVVRDASAALHRAKSEGAAQCALFDAGMHEAAIAQLRLGAELRNAIARGEFRLHYQPILRCGSGELAMLEALVRWQHPQRGCLAPCEFLQVLIDADLMTEVGKWIVSEVARQASEWRELAADFVPIAINVSPRQLGDATFLSYVRATMSAWRVPPASIVFEMTEDVELANGESSKRALHELRAAGFRVFIDDFGTGYSSLSYLQHLAIDGLKIDRAFIRDIDVDVRQREIVRAIVQLAHALGLEAVAEGVERREQMETLRSLGCDLVQGHFFSRPLAPPQMRRWLAQS
ncbi:MAG: bifunctional diguanylate cyclase/phosphodiesterase [Gemmatimonadaceae bacterium]